ncbi:MAG TPA: fructose-bisphosphatase class I, partial [Methylophilaceae bacterium]|nr:fructose-bisphosphatase class I [Methylophilaceae bacterium]
MDLKNFLADHALAALVADIAEACRQTATQVRKGALLGQMGSLGSQNVQGETQKQLDVIANDIWLQVNERHGHYAGMASEELEAPYAVPPQYRQHGRYLLLFDPLDGSS